MNTDKPSRPMETYDYVLATIAQVASQAAAKAAAGMGTETLEVVRLLAKRCEAHADLLESRGTWQTQEAYGTMPVRPMGSVTTT